MFKSGSKTISLTSGVVVMILAASVSGLAGAQQLFASAEPSPSSPPPPPAAPIPLKGDAARGRILAATCSGCHGVPGYKNAYPSYNVPKLGGQNRDYITVALQDYRRRSRGFATMQAQAAVLSDQDIADIAAYFASVKGVPQKGISDASAAEIAAGQKKITACAACHGKDGKATGSKYPNLAGQHASYLRQAMLEYKTGNRKDIIMGPMVSTLSETDMRDIAGYFAAQPGLFTIVGM